MVSYTARPGWKDGMQQGDMQIACHAYLAQPFFIMGKSDAEVVCMRSNDVVERVKAMMT